MQIKLPRIDIPGFDRFALEVERLFAAFQKPAKYTVATVPAAASNEGRVIYVSDETGGATTAFSNGSQWLRSYDLTPIS